MTQLIKKNSLYLFISHQQAEVSFIAFSPIKMVEDSKLKIDLHSLTFKLLKGEKNVTTK
jgi:hypothetical protein